MSHVNQPNERVLILKNDFIFAIKFVLPILIIFIAHYYQIFNGISGYYIVIPLLLLLKNNGSVK